MPLAVEGPINFLSHVGDSLLSVGSTMSTVLPNISNPPTGPMTDRSLAQVVAFKLKSGKQPQFMEALRRFHEAAQKTKWPGKYIWINGNIGGEPEMLLVVPRENWAGFRPPEKGPVQVMAEAVGWQDATLLFGRIADAIKSQTTTIWQYREDLSYIPNQ